MKYTKNPGLYLHSTELVLAFGLSISSFNSFIFLIYLLPPYPNVEVDRVSKNLGIHLLSIEKIFHTLLVLLLAGDMFSLWSSGLPQTHGNSPASQSWVLGWQMWASTSIRLLNFWLWKGFPSSSFLPSLSVFLSSFLFFRDNLPLCSPGWSWMPKSPFSVLRLPACYMISGGEYFF